ncbi:hypothetical protein C8Q74DRAFT_1255150 [Fomes fomentarius]|nr:hypothetical protein C8Q74DRAFT_1255150 [Fomes fomentarius]
MLPSTRVITATGSSIVILPSRTVQWGKTSCSTPTVSVIHFAGSGSWRLRDTLGRGWRTQFQGHPEGPQTLRELRVKP